MTDPHPTGRVIDDVIITGHLMVWHIDSDEPLLLLLPGSNVSVLPIFSTEEKLREAIPWMSPRGPWKTKRIDDGLEFYESIPASVRIGADPYIHNGNTRWLEIQIPGTVRHG